MCRQRKDIILLIPKVTSSSKRIQAEKDDQKQQIQARYHSSLLCVKESWRLASWLRRERTPWTARRWSSMQVCGKEDLEDYVGGWVRFIPSGCHLQLEDDQFVVMGEGYLRFPNLDQDDVLVTPDKVNEDSSNDEAFDMASDNSKSSSNNSLSLRDEIVFVKRFWLQHW